MKIVHFSDWHGKWTHLPWAEIYIVTGDMLSDHVNKYLGETYGQMSPKLETYYQAQETRQIKARKYLGNPNGFVLYVRGNHDRYDYGGMFKGGPVCELAVDQSVVFSRLKFGGTRGVTYESGEWADELKEEEFNQLVDKLPNDLDILVTHSPPHKIMDRTERYEGQSKSYGSSALSRFVTKRMAESNGLKLHCFGHVHSAAGIYQFPPGEGGTWFSNAAQGFTEFEFDGIKIQPRSFKKNIFKVESK